MAAREEASVVHSEASAEETDKMVREGSKVVQQLEQAPWVQRPKWYFEENLKYAGAEECATDSSTPPRCSHATCLKPGVKPAGAKPPKAEPKAEGEAEAGAKAGGAGADATAAAEGDKAAPKEAAATEEAEGGDAGASAAVLLRCSRCSALYCSRECQKADWKARHKRECPLVAAARSGEWDTSCSHFVGEEMLRRIRMYLCPYAVGFSLVRGPGFVLLRSNATLHEWTYGHEAVDHEGRALQRSVQLQYLTLGEFDGLAFEDDFEMALVRPHLQQALEETDPKESVVVVLLLRCGYFACVKLPLVPEYKICTSLATMYKYVEMDGPLQLNVDEKD